MTSPHDETDDNGGDPRVIARAIVLRRLTAAARSRADLAKALRQRGIPDDVVGEVLDSFEAAGLIDDAALAATLAESGRRHRGLDGAALRLALRRRGIPDDLAYEAMAHTDIDLSRDSARRLVERRLAGMSRLDPETASRRLIGVLVRRGHSPATAAAIVRSVIGARAVSDEGVAVCADVAVSNDVGAASEH